MLTSTRARPVQIGVYDHDTTDRQSTPGLQRLGIAERVLTQATPLLQIPCLMSPSIRAPFSLGGRELRQGTR